MPKKKKPIKVKWEEDEINTKHCKYGKDCYKITSEEGCLFQHSHKEIMYQRKLEEERVKKFNEFKNEEEYEQELKDQQQKDKQFYKTDRNYAYGLVLLLEANHGILPNEISKLIWEWVAHYPKEMSEIYWSRRLDYQNKEDIPQSKSDENIILSKEELLCSCCKLTTNYNGNKEEYGCYSCGFQYRINGSKISLVILINRVTNKCYRIHDDETCLFTFGLTKHNSEKCNCKSKCEECNQVYKYQLEYVEKKFIVAEMCPMTKIYILVTPISVENNDRIIDCSDRECKYDITKMEQKNNDMYYVIDRWLLECTLQHLSLFQKVDTTCIICGYSAIFYCDGLRICHDITCFWKVGIIPRRLGHQ
jgi:hypothetical protein